MYRFLEGCLKSLEKMVTQRIDVFSGLWHSTGDRYLFNLFFVKWRFISIASNLDIWHPVWRPTHDIADGFVIDILTTFDNEFIMDMTADKAVGEVTHGKNREGPWRLPARCSLRILDRSFRFVPIS